MAEQQERKLVLRPGQLPAITREGSNSGPYSAHVEWTLLFDTLPEEILNGVLRFLSLLPRTVNWDKHMPLSNVVEIYRVHGGLGTYLNSRFRT